MKLGVFTPLFANLSLDELLIRAQQAGLSVLEIGSGGNPGSHHCPVNHLLESEKARQDYLQKFADHDITISALSCHNNPLSPNREEAELADKTLRDTLKLAHLLGVPVVNTFSGIPGDSETASYPNWPTLSWPTEYQKIYKWQWETKVIPYWKDIAQVAESLDVKIGIEMHGGFSVHSPYTALKLRHATSEYIGVNFDPSHMWWQGIDPVAAIKILGRESAIVHFHAKDIYMDQDNINMYGVTDMQPYGDVTTRAWTFRSVGCGHDLKIWSDMMSHLRIYGYDGAISIEHEDPLMSIEEGFARAVKNTKAVMIHDASAEMWWV
ncbi:sugar phosphate isomerase/epimerase family protein [Erysipelothrix aquatica]|uniref:sugar phosphate isomerase/epimerase family protein n=1 Tax=Erysipelothrix aquatica TaxID=2683714 RepID=UPI0013574C0C|nr:sugar phosphate isomerase/epimerase [Erysipelothrix aquatica]